MIVKERTQSVSIVSEKFQTMVSLISLCPETPNRISVLGSMILEELILCGQLDAHLHTHGIVCPKSFV